MRRITRGMVGLVFALGFIEPVVAANCPRDSVASGTVCMDKYEASVWYVPSGENSLIRSIQKGTVTFANLTAPKAVAAGVVQLGLAAGDLAAAGCPVTGNGCVDFYAVSIPGVTPAAFITWFQAAAAARNSLKRLPTNQEWQAAALGTPDPGDDDDGATTCATRHFFTVQTGSRTSCVSDLGAFDMVGNVWEWVAEWVPKGETCAGWGPLPFSDDAQCLNGASLSSPPGALVRGGGFFERKLAGVFAVENFSPSELNDATGFRCAR